MASTSREHSDLREEIIRLGPWHHEVQVTPEISTRVSLEAPPGTFPWSWGKPSLRDPREVLQPVIDRIYPDGLQGRSVLDCACNCGGYLFLAKELGAGRCFGFDVREHWIKQARFLLEHRALAGDNIRFEVRDLYELPQIHLEPFDVTLFNGIFYHLPDPITGLKLAADLTNELMFVRTATRTDLPDGAMAVSVESRHLIMSGVYGLNWMPTGPVVMARILEWAGFSDTRLVWWAKGPTNGLLAMVASKKPGLLDRFDGPITPPYWFSRAAPWWDSEPT